MTTLMPTAQETTVTMSDGTQYLGANPQYSVQPPNPAMGIMQPTAKKVLKGRPFLKVRPSDRTLAREIRRNS